MARLGLGFLTSGFRDSPGKRCWAWGPIEGMSLASLVPLDCLPSLVPSSVGEAGWQEPAWSVKMLHFLFLTGPGFRGH